MPANPERMRPTDASQTTIVVEANEIVFQAARQIRDQETNQTRQSSFAKAAERFMNNGIEVFRKKS